MAWPYGGVPTSPYYPIAQQQQQQQQQLEAAQAHGADYYVWVAHVQHAVPAQQSSAQRSVQQDAAHALLPSTDVSGTASASQRPIGAPRPIGAEPAAAPAYAWAAIDYYERHLSALHPGTASSSPADEADEPASCHTAGAASGDDHDYGLGASTADVHDGAAAGTSHSTQPQHAGATGHRDPCITPLGTRCERGHADADGQRQERERHASGDGGADYGGGAHYNVCRWAGCDLDMQFASADHLYKHVYDDHVKALKCDYVCRWQPCHGPGVPFGQRYKLKQHVYQHTGVKLHRCAVCNKCYTQAENLKTHIRSDHTGERPYECDKCGMTFASASARGKHKHHVHGTHRRDCAVAGCDKSYKELSSLCKHMRTAHGIANYKCGSRGTARARARGGRAPDAASAASASASASTSTSTSASRAPATATATRLTAALYDGADGHTASDDITAVSLSSTHPNTTVAGTHALHTIL